MLDGLDDLPILIPAKRHRGRSPQDGTPQRAFPTALMMNDAPGLSLLEELDARQNELLDELDRLNTRIEQVIAESAAWRARLEEPVVAKAA